MPASRWDVRWPAAGSACTAALAACGVAGDSTIVLGAAVATGYMSASSWVLVVRDRLARRLRRARRTDLAWWADRQVDLRQPGARDVARGPLLPRTPTR